MNVQFTRRFVGSLLIALLTASYGFCLDRTKLGKEDKFRILVDKVLMAANGWVMTEEHIKEIRDAGFNVVCPRRGGGSITEVRRIAELARKHGLFHVVWMRGTRSTKSGVRYTHADGHSQPLYSPNSDELWNWMTKLILGHAKISTQVDSLIGTFLDFENYAPDKRGRGNCYKLSYDEKILAEFCAAKKIDPPKLKPEQRQPWLAKNGLEDEFRKFQIDSWRARCRTLRRQIDRINPNYMLVVYPVPGPIFLTDAAWPEWSTEAAPLILADASTYGRPADLMGEPDALAVNRQRLVANINLAKRRRFPFVFLGGIDPVVRGADPEFSAKNAVMISEFTNGYWVFYEGPKYDGKHPRYFEWFKKANEEIAAGEYKLHRVRRTEPMDQAAVDRKTDKLQIALYRVPGKIRVQIQESQKFETHNLQSLSLKYLKQLDVVILQDFTARIPVTTEISNNLRKFVEQGGGLFLTHDTGWFMDPIFPEIAVPAKPKFHVDKTRSRHVLKARMVIAEEHQATGNLKSPTTFASRTPDHMIFEAGPKGKVVVRDEYGQAVVVIGTFGKGRVAYSGAYYGRKAPLTGPERTMFFALLDWLATKTKPRSERKTG